MHSSAAERHFWSTLLQEIWKGSANADEPSKSDDFDDYFQSASRIVTAPISRASLAQLRYSLVCSLHRQPSFVCLLVHDPWRPPPVWHPLNDVAVILGRWLDWSTDMAVL